MNNDLTLLHLTSWTLKAHLDTVLETEKLPTRVADLNAGLTNVDRKALSHSDFLINSLNSNSLFTIFEILSRILRLEQDAMPDNVEHDNVTKLIHCKAVPDNLDQDCYTVSTSMQCLTIWATIRRGSGAMQSLRLWGCWSYGVIYSDMTVVTLFRWPPAEFGGSEILGGAI